VSDTPGTVEFDREARAAALMLHVMGRSSNLPREQVLNFKRAIGSRVRTNDVTDEERVTLAEALWNSDRSVIRIAQELEIMLPSCPSVSPRVTNMIHMTSWRQEYARNELQQSYRENPNTQSLSYRLQSARAKLMSTIVGTETAELQSCHNLLRTQRFERGQALDEGRLWTNADWERSGPPDAAGNTMDLPRAYQTLLEKTHQAVCFAGVSK
jgi:hypothetical protein